MGLVSVITPLLAVDSCFKECLESIFTQDYGAIELIVVTDEVTATSKFITHIQNSYQQKHNISFQNISIRVISAQNNKYSGIRRNIGLKEASGDYILFLDADDYFFSISVVSTLVSNIEKLGGNVLGGSCVVRDEATQTFIYRKDLVNYKFINKVSYKNFQNESGFYRFIYRRSYLLDNDELFPDLRRFQDSVFMVKALNDAGDFYLIADIVYVYRKGHKELNWDLNMYQDHLKGLFEVLDLAIAHNYLTLQRKMLQNIVNTMKIRFPKKEMLLRNSNEQLNLLSQAHVAGSIRQVQKELLKKLLTRFSLIGSFPLIYLFALGNIVKNFIFCMRTGN